MQWRAEVSPQHEHNQMIHQTSITSWVTSLRVHVMFSTIVFWKHFCCFFLYLYIIFSVMCCVCVSEFAVFSRCCTLGSQGHHRKPNKRAFKWLSTYRYFIFMWTYSHYIHNLFVSLEGAAWSLINVLKWYQYKSCFIILFILSTYTYTIYKYFVYFVTS